MLELRGVGFHSGPPLTDVHLEVAVGARGCIAAEQDRGLARERAIRLHMRPTRWPEDATIGEANEFLR